MPRRSRQNDPEKLQQKLVELLTNFSEELKKENLGLRWLHWFRRFIRCGIWEVL